MPPRFFDILLRASSPGASLLISVPIGVGPSLLLKQAQPFFKPSLRTIILAVPGCEKVGVGGGLIPKRGT